ncbi:MAG: ATP-binding protein [Myxococcota bacterium]
MPAEKQEVSRRFFGALLGVARTRLGEAQIEELLTGTGMTLKDLTDEGGWVSLAFTEQFLERLVERWGGEDLLRVVGEVTFTGPHFGYLASVFRTADPGPNYRQAVQMTAMFNKVGRFEISGESARSMDLRYVPVDDEHRETRRHCCILRQHQLAGVPRLLGLPSAQVTESECVVRGDTACVYHVHWESARPRWGEIVGGAALAVGVLGAAFAPTALAAQLGVCLGVCGFLAGALVTTRQRLRAVNALAEERGVAVKRSTAVLEKKYAELLAAKREVDAKVDERTAQLRETGHQLEQSLAQLQTLTKQKDTFFENVSHELRTPLTLILAPLESILAGEMDAAQQREAMNAMLRSGRRLHRLINQLLDLARADVGRLTVRLQNVELSDLLRELVGQFQPAAQHAGLTLELNSPHDATVIGDGERLEEIFTNLLGNALKCTPQGGTIRVEVQRVEGRVKVTVADTGVGIPPEDLSRIFQRFARVERQSRGEGTGIGLALTQELVRLHHGEISVRSEVGKGTTFTVDLPAGNNAEVAQRVARAPRPILDEAPVTFADPPHTPTGEREDAPLVYVVEDHDDLRRYVTELLSRAFRVQAFPDAECCLKALQGTHPDVIVSDVMMPGITGVELARRLKADTNTRGIRIILATARGSGDDAVAGLDAGADDYVRKPFSPPELRARVRTQCQLKRLTEQLINSEKHALIGTFAAGLAHEVRNPAAAIQGCVEPLRRLVTRHLPNPPPALQEALRVVDESAGRITSLVRDVLDFAHVNRAQVSPYDINQGIETCLRILGHRLNGHVEVVRHLDYAAPVHCQPALINQAVMNLLDNAARAVASGGRIEVRTSPAEGGVNVVIQDSGPGIDARTLRHAFDPFFTTRPPGEGTGLGLPLSRQIVEAHGGRLTLSSEPGVGTVASVWLPAQPSSTQQQEV